MREVSRACSLSVEGLDSWVEVEGLEGRSSEGL
jgi:hypothetical protein